ncbi:ABC transporter permease [Gryllotalpicola protaetiae]|uniref:ABC transporter permease n=1 Tax=Gryllotalpicola protaetiae TaxID=2419771 RepID=A0A387BW86_9MICO|nr:ABC transporter permease [Gryllotalpicola protaetiae]
MLNENLADGATPREHSSLGAERATAHRAVAAERSRARFLLAALKRPGLVISVLVIALVILWAFAPGLFTHHDPLVGNVVDRLQAPTATHIFGTDNLGRDLWARVVYGSAQSLAATFLAVVLALVVGSVLGLLAGFLRGWVDDVIMRVMDVVLAIPTVLLSLAIITALGFGIVNVAVAVGFASAASFARVMRSEVITISTALYVEAARASGVRWYTVLRRHVLPNSLGPVLSLSALEFGTAVLAISSLSFLGFGAPPPAPEWGALISEGRNYLATSWWLTTFPGLVIVLVVLSANRISRAFEKNGAGR